MLGVNKTRWENPFQKAESHVWHRVTAGFFVLIPVLATFIILRFIINYVDDIFHPFVNGRPFDFPGIGLVITFVVLYIIGMIVTGRLGKITVETQHAILSKIPIVKSIYGVTKQATDTLFAYNNHQFRRVVLVEWPRPNVYAIGFVTGQCEIQNEDTPRLVVYIPTVPNPTSGMLTIISQEDVTNTDMSVEDAVKLVFSGGIVLPDKIDTADSLSSPIYLAAEIRPSEPPIRPNDSQLLSEVTANTIKE